MDVKMNGREKIRSHTGTTQIKWWHLKDEKQESFQHKILEGEFGQPQGSANDMRNNMAQEIRKVTTLLQQVCIKVQP